MSLGPIDREMANPSDVVGAVGRRRPQNRDGVADVHAVSEVDGPLGDDQRGSGQHTWDENPEQQPEEDQPIIDELA